METMLTMLKTNLGIMSSTAYDTRLTQLLTVALQAIINEGASTLDASNNVLDMQLVVMYAEWLWRRRDTGDGMPRMLRLALNNRIMGEKAATSDD